MLAAAGGIISREYVSVSRCRSTSGVNLKLYGCAREYEALLGDTEVLTCAIGGQTRAVSKEDL